MMREAALYPPVKAFLEAQGWEVKAEVGACDLMACREGDPPLVVELKTSFTLGLVLQGVARQALVDTVYLAVPVGPKGWSARYKDIIALCRRLGLGLLAVRPDDTVEAHLDPGPYLPRQNAARRGRLLREFQRRVGDPNVGGTTGIKRMTAYRQDALRCLAALASGPRKSTEIAKETGVARASSLMRDDHYGWFDHPARGVYAASPKGVVALAEQAAEILRLAPQERLAQQDRLAPQDRLGPQERRE